MAFASFQKVVYLEIELTVNVPCLVFLVNWVDSRATFLGILTF